MFHFGCYSLRMSGKHWNHIREAPFITLPAMLYFIYHDSVWPLETYWICARPNVEEMRKKKVPQNLHIVLHRWGEEMEMLAIWGTCGKDKYAERIVGSSLCAQWKREKILSMLGLFWEDFYSLQRDLCDAFSVDTVVDLLLWSIKNTLPVKHRCMDHK